MVILDNNFLSRGFSGLYNIGNTCYLNAVLQSLSNLVPLTKYFHENDMNKFSKNKYYDIMKNYQLIITELWKENIPLGPKSFKRYIDMHYPKYSDSNQHDSHEFLVDLLESLNIALSKKALDIKISDFSSKHHLEAKKIWRSYFKCNNSIISDLFYGQFIREFRCKSCFNSYFNYDPFSSLILSYANPDPISIIDLINFSYYNRDYVQSKCSKCSEKYNEEHEVTTRIYKLPEVLVVVVKRFNNYLTKNSVNIKVDEILDLSDITAGNSDESVFYDLSSIICHSGRTITSGHYYSIIRRNNAYYQFDDSIISEYDIKSLDGTSPYILFYTRKNSK